MLVNSCSELHLIGSASRLGDALPRIEALKPDLVISDIALEDSTGLDTVRAVLDAQEGRPVLVISMHDEVLFGEQVLAMGARGFLMKESAHAHCLPAALHIL